MRRARSAHQGSSSPLVGVAAGGAFLVFLVQASVDWIHLIPGITGLALCAAACLVGPWRPLSPGAAPRRWLRTAAVLACGLLCVGGAVLLGRATLAEHYRAQSEDALAADPRRALDKAGDALALSDQSLPSHYARAAALARLGRYEPARAALREATQREPSDYVPWALLGDLAVRRGDFAQARSDYGRAAELNPRDAELREIAENPRRVLIDG